MGEWISDGTGKVRLEKLHNSSISKLCERKIIIN